MPRLTNVIVTALVAAFLLTSGCHGGPGAPASGPLAETPAAVEGRTPAELASYEAWTRHTSGDIGEDLHGVLSPGHGVLFASSRFGPDLKLCLRPPRGHVVRVVTSGPGHDLHPAPAPDGRRVAFVSTRHGSPGLYLLADLDGDRPRRIGPADADAVHPSWSPDGREIAYSRRSPVSGRWEIWIHDLARNESRYVTEGLFPEFDPAGERLAFQRARRRDDQWFSIWTVRIDGTREQEIISGPDWGAVNPTWSPDGRWLAFNTVSRNASPSPANDESRGHDIWCVRDTGQQPVRITTRRGAEWNPRWGADGRIYFSSDASGGTAVWSVDPGVLNTVARPASLGS